MLLFLGVDKKEVLAKGRGCTFIDKDSSHTKRLIIARYCAKYLDVFCNIQSPSKSRRSYYFIPIV